MANNKRKHMADEDSNPPQKHAGQRSASGGQQCEAMTPQDTASEQSQRKRTSKELPKKLLKRPDAPTPQNPKPRHAENSTTQPDTGATAAFQALPESPKQRAKFTLSKPFIRKEDFERNDFPAFQDGNILLVLDKHHTYLLHAHVMHRASIFLKDDAEVKMDEPLKKMIVYKKPLDVGAMRRYEMTQGESGYILKRTPVTEVVQKPPVVVDTAVEHMQPTQDSLADAPQLPGRLEDTLVAGTSEPLLEPQLPTSSAQAIPRSVAESGSGASRADSVNANANTAASLPAAGPSGVAAYQPTSIPPDPRSALHMDVANGNPTSAVPLTKTVRIKQEDGTIVKEEVAADPMPSNAAPSPSAAVFIQAGLNIANVALPENQAQDDDDKVMKDHSPPIPTPDPCPILTHSDYIFGFHSFFQLAYNHPISISTTCVDDALRQCEALLAAAKSLDGLRIVSAHIASAITMFGKVVYTSILENPRRWLKFAVNLQHVVLFKEALVHVVGNYPDHITDMTFSMLSPATADLVKRKADWLHRQMLEVHARVLAASLTVGPTAEEAVRASWDKTQCFDAWFMVQCWKSWYGDKLAEVRDVARTPENPRRDFSNSRRLDTMAMTGAIFRTLNNAGNAYLPKDEVLKLLTKYQRKNEMTGFLCFIDWEADLKRMKDFAKMVVQHLLVNNSMLAPDEHGVRYLTCTMATEDELPWNRE